MKFTLQDGKHIDLPDHNDRAAANYLADLMMNQGRNEDDGVSIGWEDFAQYLRPMADNRAGISTSEIRPFLQTALEVVIRNPLQPILNITGLYDMMRAPSLQTQVLTGAMGAVVAGDVSEGGTYPEVMFDIGGGMQTAYVGKTGIAASFTDEALRASTWDLMGLNLREMAAAMDRLKEQKAVSFLHTLGIELFNNATPSTSLFGVTTGRGLDMAANGTLIMDDLLRGYAHLADQGFPPNVLLINPQYYYMWLQDPTLRAMMIAHGGGAWIQQWQGVPGPLDPWSNGAMGGRGPSHGNSIVPAGSAGATGIAGREHGMTSTPPFPAPAFPFPMEIVVSPFVPFDPVTQLGDIYLLRRGEVGLHLVEEDRVRVEWRDENTETVKVKLRERYGFAVKNEGEAIGVFKNVKLGRNYWDGTVQASAQNAPAEIPAETPVV